MTDRRRAIPSTPCASLFSTTSWACEIWAHEQNPPNKIAPKDIFTTVCVLFLWQISHTTYRYSHIFYTFAAWKNNMPYIHCSFCCLCFAHATAANTPSIFSKPTVSAWPILTVHWHCSRATRKPSKQNQRHRECIFGYWWQSRKTRHIHQVQQIRSLMWLPIFIVNVAHLCCK